MVVVVVVVLQLLLVTSGSDGASDLKRRSNFSGAATGAVGMLNTACSSYLDASCICSGFGS